MDSFKNARPSVLSLAREKEKASAAAAQEGEREGDDDDLEQPAAKKRRLDRPPDEPNRIQSERRRTRSQGRRATENQVPAGEYEVIEDSEDDDYVPGELPYLTLWFFLFLKDLR